MAAIQNELVTNFAFTGNISKLTQYNSSFQDALGLMTKGIGVVTALQSALTGFATAQLQSIDAMGQLSKETATSVEFLQEMGYVASVNGGSVEALQDSVRGLSERIGEYASMDSGEGKAIFEKLGIAVKNANGEVKNAETIMEELRGKFKNISKVEQVSIAQKLGINKGMLQTLNLTNDEIDTLKKRVRSIGVVTTEQAQSVMAFNDAITTSNMALGGISRQIALGMLPNMMNMVSSFNDFLFANSDLITNGLSKTIYWLQGVIDAVTNTGKAIISGVDYFIGLENAAYLLGTAILYVNRAMLLNPIGLFVALIAGLIIVVDDLYVAFNGGKSVIKDFFASFDIDIVNTLRTAFDGLKITFNAVLILMLRISEAFTSLTTVAAKAGNFLGMDIDTKALEDFKKMQEQTRLNLTSENLKLGSDILNRNYTTSQNVTITQNIQGQDAKGIADLSGEGISTALGNANNQLGKGGR